MNKNKKIFIAMSGGIDSSVAAAILKKAGFNLIGVFMKFWSDPENNNSTKNWNRCCSTEAELKARKIAKILKIPFYIFNFEKEFKKKIVDYFLNEYKKGRTPNPCVICNKEIKFGLFFKKALALGADYIATGHYARLRQKNSKIELLKAKDKNKDQSYFLWKLNQKQLKHVLFPIGNYTKTQVKEMAKKFNLSEIMSDVKESMEICFVKTTVNNFLKKYLKTRPGKIIDSRGKIIGMHQGLHFFTIGQRKGIELAGNGPFYVLDKNIKKNELIVSNFINDKKSYNKKLVAQDINWISGNEPILPLKVKAQIRYRHKPVSAMIIKKLKNKNFEIIFTKPQRAITPGQSIVFYSYSGEKLLGGGIIIK